MEQGQPAPAAAPDASPDAAAAHVPIPFSADDFRNEIKRVKRRRRLAVVLGVVVAILIALAVVAVVVFRIPGSLYTVSSDAMLPTLKNGQVVHLQEIESPASQDIVVYRTSDGATQVKRVVAIAGEWVNISSDGTAVVSPAPLEGGVAVDGMPSDATIIASRQVPDSACFVLADSDSSALEALYQADSYISYSQLVGRVSAKVWPPM